MKLFEQQEADQLIVWLEDLINGEFKLVHEYMEGCSSQVDHGLCYLLHYMFRASVDNFELLRPGWLNYVEHNYKLFSGDISYPVPAPAYYDEINSARNYFMNKDGKWSGEYGDNRKKLAQCTIEWIKQSIKEGE